MTTRSLLRAAVFAEARKAAASPVVVVTGVLVVVGITVLATSMTLAAQAGNEQIRAQLGDLVDAEGWALYTGALVQITGAAAFLGLGVALSWLVGREFADGTVSGLFALPVSRATTALAKLLVYTGWALGVALALAALASAAGVVIGLGWPDAAAASALVRLLVLVVLTAAIATPAAWAATAGRGLLPGIAVTVVVIASAQVLAVAGTGGWWPFAAPALWAIDPAAVSGAQLAASLVVPLVFAALTLHSWSRLQLDR